MNDEATGHCCKFQNHLLLRRVGMAAGSDEIFQLLALALFSRLVGKEIFAMEELTATYDRERVRFENGDDEATAILLCSDASGKEIIIRASVGVDETLVAGLDYRWYGRWMEHAKYGRQFHAKTFVKQQPHNRVGVIRYLRQAPHVGTATASTLWEKFGGQAVAMLREHPDVAACAVGGQFSETRAKEAAAFLRQEQALESVTIDLMDLLDGRGFPRATGKRCVGEWGNQAAELIRRNPYLLMRFRGCGFLRTDQLYLDLGGRPESLKRQALAGWYSIARDTEGHTWHQPSAVVAGIAERIAGAETRPVRATKLAIRGRMLTARRDADGGLWLAERRKADNEAAIATRVRRWLGEPKRAWPSVYGGSECISLHQAVTLQQGTTKQIGILTGGPGTGKTYSAARLIELLQRLNGSDSITVCAPTGKAAVRITEAMQGYGIDLRARTIHSLLGVASRSEGDDWGFQHNEGNPLPFRFIVVDEASMIDVDLFASLCRACGPGTHLLLVGDTGQLPPVGHGAPLRDLIAAGVPCGELTEIRRNSGQIVKACHQIRKGDMFEASQELRPDLGDNLKFLPAATSAASLDKIVETIRTIGRKRLADPVWECQVIVAVNDRSELSRKAVNQRLQQELNPGGAAAPGNPFRAGDKVVCLKNGFYPVVTDSPPGFNEQTTEGKVFVANGEQGAVKHVEATLTVVQLSAPSRLVKVPRGGQQSDDGNGVETPDSTAGCQWDLAYGISCHKSQGSEWPIVLVVLDEYPGARMVCSCEWIYTAMSRAKQACLLVGKEQTAFGMIQRQAIQRRKTFLKELIQS